jgi:hypothetical protein
MAVRVADSEAADRPLLAHNLGGRKISKTVAICWRLWYGSMKSRVKV